MRYLAIILLAVATLAVAEPVYVKEWLFDTPEQIEVWSQKTNDIKNIHLEEGALMGTLDGGDPWLTSPAAPFKASPWQAVEIELKTDLGGDGQLYYTDTPNSPDDGFFADRLCLFTIVGDNQWHTYTVYPFWQTETILKLRLDFPHFITAEDKGHKSFAVRQLRILDFGHETPPPMVPLWKFANGAAGWEALSGQATTSPEGLAVSRQTPLNPLGIRIMPLNVAVDDHGCWLHMEMACDGAKKATVTWLTDSAVGLKQKTFSVVSDGQMHHYNVDMSSADTWNGHLLLLQLALDGNSSKSLIINELGIHEQPCGPVLLSVPFSGLTDALCRAGRKCDFMVRVANHGGTTARDLRPLSMEWPSGVKMILNNMAQEQDVEPFDNVDFYFTVMADQPVSGPYTLVFSNDDGDCVTAKGQMEFTAAPDLPKASYVPEPQPVDTGDYEVGALYFPGWDNQFMIGWPRIFARCPERKPLLGWYDETNPECVDWQIKWLVENGIRYLMVDWYWNKGEIYLEHWIQAFKKSRYRQYLKWGLMWANHNGPNSHSEEDMVAATTYWLENYFNMPEYYTIDGKPVVMFWSPEGLERDMDGRGGAARLLDLSRQTAIAAGLPGIHFSAMKWPEAEATPNMINALKAKGFDSTFIYHYMGHDGLAEDPSRFPFELVAQTNKDLWNRLHDVGILPFFMNLSTGWDDRPWNNDCEIYGRTPELFRRICLDAKDFADKNNHRKQILLSPLTEWGEGSYAEPNKEFGFGMYEAVRDTFATKPADGWPLNYGPADVGLGPYDVFFPPKVHDNSSMYWNFDDGTNQGWLPTMGIKESQVVNGVLTLRTNSDDPALSISLGKLSARKFATFNVRMKVSPSPDGKPDMAQLFWATSNSGLTEDQSLRKDVPADGQFHDIVFDLTQAPQFKGMLTEFRFDPSCRKDIDIEIDSMKLDLKK